MSSFLLDFELSRSTNIGRIATSMTFDGFLARLAVLGAVYVMSWAVWHISGFVRNWLRVKRGLAQSDIPQGPNRGEIFALFSRHDPHRAMHDLVEKYGRIFYSEFLHIHVGSLQPISVLTLPVSTPSFQHWPGTSISVLTLPVLTPLSNNGKQSRTSGKLAT
jgi:hypothetical protein